jgi:hypothetical protein
MKNIVVNAVAEGIYIFSTRTYDKSINGLARKGNIIITDQLLTKRNERNDETTKQLAAIDNFSAV